MAERRSRPPGGHRRQPDPPRHLERPFSPGSPAWNTNASSPRKASTRSTRWNGTCARRSSAARRVRSSSSSATSKSRASGRSRRPTSSSPSTSAARSGTPERERSVKQLIGRVVDTITEWAVKQKYFATDEDLSAFSDDLKHLLVYQKAAFNSPVWFNVGFEKAPQCSACFINSVQDTMESILGAGEDRGDALQVRVGHRLQPFQYPLVEGAPRRRRDRVRSGVVHEGLRRVRRGHQVGRQDAPRRQDGHPQRRASRHRGVHQLQGRGREEGLGAHRRRLRRLVHGRRLRLGLLPELQQLRPRDRRVHARGAGRRGVDDQGGARRRADGDLQGARPDAADCRGHVDLRRSRHAVRHDRSTTGTPARTRRGSTRATRARSTCSSTTRRATCRPST